MMTPTADQTHSLLLTGAQRRLIAELNPKLAGRLKLNERNQRSIRFSDAEVRSVQLAAETALPTTDSGVQRNSLRHIIHKSKVALGQPEPGRTGKKPDQIYRLKITLLGFKPLIWRRIEVKDCTFDELHEYIQAAMGWTNSHLHQFEILGQCVGNPGLLDDGFSEFECIDSRTTRLSDFLPAGTQGVRFLYEYDFGDSWEHEIRCESIGPAEDRKRYPVCLGGKGACPPEDIGGVWGYAEFLKALLDPHHEDHASLLDWYGGSFDPREFDPQDATRNMSRRLGDY